MEREGSRKGPPRSPVTSSSFSRAFHSMQRGAARTAPDERPASGHAALWQSKKSPSPTRVAPEHTTSTSTVEDGQEMDEAKLLQLPALRRWDDAFAELVVEDEFLKAQRIPAMRAMAPRVLGGAAFGLFLATVFHVLHGGFTPIGYVGAALSVLVLGLALAMRRLSRAQQLPHDRLQQLLTAVLALVLMLIAAQPVIDFGGHAHQDAAMHHPSRPHMMDASLVLIPLGLALISLFADLPTPHVAVVAGLSALSAAVSHVVLSAWHTQSVLVVLGLLAIAVVTPLSTRRAARLQRGQYHFYRSVMHALYEVHKGRQERVSREEALSLEHAAKDARSRLIRVVMHDLRSPLLAVHNLASFLATKPPESLIGAPDVVDSVAALESCSALMQRIVSDMLDFERIDSGRLQLVYAPFQPAQLLREVFSTYSKVAQTKGVELSISLEAARLESLSVYGDVRRIQQCINNGVSNSIKFTEAGGAVSLELGEREHEQAAAGFRKLRIVVRDNGHGLSRAELKQLNTGGPFQQVGKGQLQGNGGTGLGLSITRQLLALHHGSELRLWSAGPGLGSSFEMNVICPPPPPAELPLAQPGARPAGQPPSAPNVSCRLPADAPAAAGGEAEPRPPRQSMDDALDETDADVMIEETIRRAAITSRPEMDSKEMVARRASPALYIRRSRAASSRRASRSQSCGNNTFASNGSVGDASSSGVGGGPASAEMVDRLVIAGTGAHERSPPPPGGTERPAALETAAQRMAGTSATAGTAPLALASTAALASADPAPPADGPPTLPPAFRCLHVEDDAMLRMTLPISTFVKLGCEYDQAVNGEDAMRLVHKRKREAGHEYDVVVMDNQMPVMTGAACTRELRLNGYRGIIIGLTGDPTGCSERDEFEAAGLDLCCDKDLAGIEMILETIKKTAAGAGSEAAEHETRARRHKPLLTSGMFTSGDFSACMPTARTDSPHSSAPGASRAASTPPGRPLERVVASTDADDVIALAAADVSPR